MHSVMTSATGSTAIVIGVCLVRGGVLCSSITSAASVLLLMFGDLFESPEVSSDAVCMGTILLTNGKTHTSS
jgi:hypothetical protein